MRLQLRGRAARVWITALVLSGCGGDSGGGVEVDAAVAPFVGDWTATVFTVTHASDQGTVADILSAGSFTINVQPSGLYTATLLVGGPPPAVEIGDLTVSGNTITLAPTGKPAVTSTFAFDAEDSLTLDGPTEFDFNGDGSPEDGHAHIELERS